MIRVIKKLSVKNFKSIKELEIDCKRINLFIGEPNTGKSNILETLGLLSWVEHGKDVPLKKYVRFQGVHNLFYDNSTAEPISVYIGETEAEIELSMEFRDEVFSLGLWGTSAESTYKEPREHGFMADLLPSVGLDYSGERINSWTISNDMLKIIKFYRFEKQDKFPDWQSSFLMPPHGSNMLAVVMGNRKLRTSMARFFKDYGFELVLRQHDKAFEFQKRMEDEDIDSIFIYPYISASDTLQRMIFYTLAIESNENSTLIFEEPEAHAFPYYTKYLGEKIAFDETNQYFIATHNPYLLLSILEKTPENDVNVFVTYLRDYQTRVKCLNDEEISELMQYEPFFNLDSFIEEEEEEEQ